MHDKRCNETVGRRFQSEDAVLDANQEFQRDIGKIQHSQSFLRLSDCMTFVPDFNYLHGSQLLHAFDVAENSGKISEKLGLNTYLTKAIALSHDFGKAPFGKIGEIFLDKKIKESEKEFKNNGFKHNIASVVFSQYIEPLNLCFETYHGQKSHSRGYRQDLNNPSDHITFESASVSNSDKISFVIRDLHCALKMGIIDESRIPSFVWKWGKTPDEQINTLIDDIVLQSYNNGAIGFGISEIGRQFDELRNDIMYEQIYHAREHDKYEEILGRIYEFFEKNQEHFEVNPIVATNILSCRCATNIYNKARTDKRDIEIEDAHAESQFMMMLKNIKGKDIDITDPDISWGEQRYLERKQQG